MPIQTRATVHEIPGLRILVRGRPHTIEPTRGGSPIDLLSGSIGFRQWLLTMPSDATVGVRGSITTCPIALYMRCKGVVDPSVGSKAMRWNVDSRQPRTAPSFMLPAWAREFVGRVDDDWRECISAGRALAILAEVAA